jgi:hypothetical protein
MPKHSLICRASSVDVDPTSHENNVEAKSLLKSGVASHCKACKQKWKEIMEAPRAPKPPKPPKPQKQPKSPKPPKSYQAVYAGAGVAVLLLVCFCIARYKK